MGIEPTCEAWEAPILPLNYARKKVVSIYQKKRRLVKGDFSQIEVFCFEPGGGSLCSPPPVQNVNGR